MEPGAAKPPKAGIDFVRRKMVLFVAVVAAFGYLSVDRLPRWLTVAVAIAILAGWRFLLRPRIGRDLDKAAARDSRGGDCPD